MKAKQVQEPTVPTTAERRAAPAKSSVSETARLRDERLKELADILAGALQQDARKAAGAKDH